MPGALPGGDGGPLRLGIVGCGKIAEHHARAVLQYEAAGRVQVTSLVDPQPARRAAVAAILGEGRAEQLVLTEDLATLLASDAPVDAVLVAIPHDLHEEVALAALAAGVHVLLEKPLAPTLDACARLEAAAATSPGMLVVSEQSPHWPEVAKAAQLIRDGVIGEVVGATADYYESMSRTPFGGSEASEAADPFDLGWRRSVARSGGGVVIDGGLHWLRPLRMLMGEAPSEVVAATANPFSELGTEGETLAHAILRSPSGRLATFRAAVSGAGAMAHASAPFLRVTGRTGELALCGTALHEGGGGLRLFRRDLPAEGVEQLPAPPAPRGFCAAWSGMHAEFLQIVEAEDREASLANVHEAKVDVATALAIYESARGEAGWVRVAS